MKRRGVVITLLITLLAVIFYGYRYLSIPVGTKVAALTQREDVILSGAYVIRTEEVYDAQVAGTMYNYVEEGDRVSKNMCISTVYQGSVDASLVQNLNNINNRMQKLEEAKAKSEKFITDSGSIDNTVEKVKNEIIDAVVNGNVDEIEDCKNTLKALNNDGVKEFDTDLKELIKQKWEIESKLSNDKFDINSTMAGIFSLNVDGYEKLLTPETIIQYKVEDFEQVTNPNVPERTTNEVLAGENVCKVVDNHTWYVMTTVSKSEAEQIKEKKEVILRFLDLPGAEVIAEVKYISEESEQSDKVVVVLKSDRYLEGVYGMRYGDIEIVINRYTGYEIPIHSLRVVEEKTGVMIMEGISEVFCETKVVYSDEKTGIAIVYPKDDAKRKLSMGDRILLGEKKKE